MKPPQRRPLMVSGRGLLATGPSLQDLGSNRPFCEQEGYLGRTRDGETEGTSRFHRQTVPLRRPHNPAPDSNSQHEAGGRGPGLASLLTPFGVPPYTLVLIIPGCNCRLNTSSLWRPANRCNPARRHRSGRPYSNNVLPFTNPSFIDE